jgi:hypothetical protein
VNISPFAAWAGGGDYTLISSPGGGIDKTKVHRGTLPVALYTTPPNFTTFLNRQRADPAPGHGRTFPAPLTGAGISPLSGTTVPARTPTWSNQAGNVDTAQFPGGNSDVVFSSAATTGNRNTTLGANIGIKGLTFADANAVIIGGINTLSIGANGITSSSGFSALHTITTAALVLNGNQIWTNDSGAALTVNAPISGPYGITFTRNTGGAGTFLLNSPNTYSGGSTINTGAAVKLGNASALGQRNLTMNGGTLDLNNLNLTGRRARRQQRHDPERDGRQCYAHLQRAGQHRRIVVGDHCRRRGLRRRRQDGIGEPGV